MRALACLISSVVLLGCDSPTEPPDPLSVNFAQSVSQKGWNAQTSRHECHYVLTATASGGRSGAYALWVDSEVQFRYPNGAVQTFQLSAVDMLDYWGSERIMKDETQMANRIAWATSGFELFYTLRYVDRDDRFSSKIVVVDCR